MAETKTDVTIDSTDGWVDLVATYADFEGVPVYLQNKSTHSALYVFFGGATEPDDMSGIVLDPNEITFGAADNLWVRTRSTEQARIGCGLADA